ncbi:MAG: phage tail protein [Acidimicrobiales bacterium]
MRAIVPGLEHPDPLGLTLPALYQEDDLVQRLCAGLDEVTAPVVSVLDCIEAYFDPALAPEDFLAWLAGWVAVALDETWPVERRRLLVSSAVDLYGRQGTVAGIAGAVSLYTGVEPEVVDSGGTAWSATPGGDLPGRSEPDLVVRVRLPGAGEDERRRIEAIVEATKPAHVPHRVEVLD